VFAQVHPVISSRSQVHINIRFDPEDDSSVDEDWEEEIRLSRAQVVRCVAALEQVGLRTKKARSPFHKFAPVIHYRFDVEVLNEKAEAFFENASAETLHMRGLRKSNLPLSNKSDVNDSSKSLHTESIEKSMEEESKSIAPATRDALAPSQISVTPDASFVERDEISTPAEHSPKAGHKSKGEQHPLQSSAKGSPTPRSLLAWIIDDVWAGQQSERHCSPGMSKRLIGPLMGTAKQIDNRLEPKATEEEIYAFGRWYRYYNLHLPMPMEAKVASWFGQFRAAPDYASRVNDARLYVERLYRNPLSPQEEKPVVYVDPAVARAAVQDAMRAMWGHNHTGDAK